MIRNLILLLLMPWCLLAGKVSVLPTQGKAGDNFHFQVILDKQEKSRYERIYLRLYEKSGDYYDYVMQKSASAHYRLTISIDEVDARKTFIVGFQDLHGEIIWQSKRHTFRVIESDDDTFETLRPIDPVDDIEKIYVKQVMQNVLDCLNRKRGYTEWDGIRHYGCWVRGRNTYCARFVRMCFGEPRKFGTAIAMYRHFKAQGVVKRKGIPPKGAVVFYATRSGYGHTGIADGTGGLFSAASYIRGVKHDMTFTAKAKYLGYVRPFDFKAFY